MSSSRPLWILAVWLVVNLLQAALSPLDPDETYYWMYASQLAWGYFDHPPAVAILVALGRDWLPGSLGLRFGHVLAGTATLVAIYYLLDRPRGRDLWLAALLVFAQPMLQVYGFIATPDGPLLLFTALYLLAYRRFLLTPDLKSGALWGLTMAGLMYSKYHGAVLILFTVLPHLAWLLKRPGAWLAAIGGAALFMPHLYWQYANDYPSFRYHLSGRDDPYQFKFTVQYVLNQLAIFSPLLVYYYVRTFIADRPHDRFERACRWLVVGFLLFFLYTTTKGRTEAQWTALLSLPLIYLTYRAALRFPGWQPRLRTLCLLTIGILIAGRLLLIAPRDWLPFEKPFDHAPWVARMTAEAGSLPVIFENSYRLASLYEFYSGGRPAWTFTDVDYRPNQYDLWQDDRLFHGRPVLVAGQRKWRFPETRVVKLQKGDMKVRRIEDFQVAKATTLELTVPPPTELTVEQRYPISVSATAELPLDLRSGLPLSLFAILTYPDGDHRYWRLSPPVVTELPAGVTTPLFQGDLRISPTLPPGRASLSLGLAYRGMPPLRGQSGGLEVRVLPAE